jgi:peptide/nickel transport system permease protein
VIPFVLRRLGFLVVTLVAGSVLIFLIMQLVPGGAATAAAGPEATAETIAMVAKELGLDQPLHIQYGRWIFGVLQGDLGNAYVGKQDVGQQLVQRLPLSLQLTTLAFIVSLVVGCTLGYIAGMRLRKPSGKVINALSSLGIAVPGFWLAMILVLIFALNLRWFPATGFIPISQGLGRNLWSLVLPVVAISAGSSAIIARQTRSAVIETLEAPYMRAGRALGLPKRTLYGSFLIRNAVLPIITVLGLTAAGMLGAQVLAESVFVLPGLGSMLAPAVPAKDLPVVQGVTLVYLLIVAIVNILVDVVHAALDPRVRAVSAS